MSAARGGHGYPTDAHGALAGLALSVRSLRRTLTGEQRTPGAVGDAVRHIRRSTAVVVRQRREIRAWSRGLPTLTLTLSDDAIGRSIRTNLCTHQPWPFRFRAVAAIALPDTAEAYLRGRSRQAVRTNRRHALGLGQRVVRAASTAEARALVATMLDRRRFYASVDVLAADLISLRYPQLWFVLDADGVAIAFAAVAVDGRLAQLQTLQVAVDGADRSAARYLLSSEILGFLAADGVRHVVVDSMLFAAPGVVYLEHRLGFRPTNVVVRDGRRHPRGAAAPSGRGIGRGSWAEPGS